VRELLQTLDAWKADGVEAGRAVVVRTFGSSPRPEGSVFLLARDGRIAGSVSGGCVEAAVAEEIERAWQTGQARVIRYGISDEQAWSVGLACGATIDVLVEPRVPDAAIRAARTTAAGGRGVAVATPLPAHREPPEEPILIDADAGLTGSLGDPALDRALASAAAGSIRAGASATLELGGREVFVETFGPRPRLVVVGGTEVARALVSLARRLGYETVVVDGRAAFVTPERFPDADRLVVGWPDEVAEALGIGPEDAVAILSHDPKFDEPGVLMAIRRGARYVGAIGSRKTQAARREALRAAGVSETDLARLHGPVGLDLGGQEPAEIALAILAEIVATRHGASGRPLVEG